TVSISVGTQLTQLRYLRPFPAEGTANRTVDVNVDLRDSQLVPLVGKPIELRFAGQVIPTTTSINGFAGATLDLHVPVGTYDLEVVYGGDGTYAPTTLHQPFEVIGGSAPVPSIEGPISGEAGYPVR